MLGSVSHSRTWHWESKHLPVWKYMGRTMSWPQLQLATGLPSLWWVVSPTDSGGAMLPFPFPIYSDGFPFGFSSSGTWHQWQWVCERACIVWCNSAIQSDSVFIVCWHTLHAARVCSLCANVHSMLHEGVHCVLTYTPCCMTVFIVC